MNLRQCASCGKVTSRAVCPCGFDPQWATPEYHKLTQPPTGAVILPFSTLKKLTKAGRQAVARAVSKARGD